MPPRKRSKSMDTSIGDYIPPSLSEYVYPYHGDFCYSFSFHPKLIALLMAEGFLPIATKQDDVYILLPKLHQERCVIQLCQSPAQHSVKQTTTGSSSLHISRSTRKKSRRFAMTVNQDFTSVVNGCSQQHGEHCWLYEPYIESLRSLWQTPVAVALPSESNSPCQQVAVRVWSIEVWEEESGKLVAGELGYSVGKVYTSLTGFSRQDSAGSVQLAALGRLLTKQGFQLWDLGMDIDYKASLGSELMERDTFCRVFREARYHTLELPSADRVNCREIIDDDKKKT